MLSKPTTGIAVDGSCIGNPGQAEYKGVDLETGKELFKVSIGMATNNIAEFIAIVHGLAYAKVNKINPIIWTDSQTAIAWIRKRKCNTNFSYSGDLLKRAEIFLNDNRDGKVEKWMTRQWGEIPADFGRKNMYYER